MEGFLAREVFLEDVDFFRPVLLVVFFAAFFLVVFFLNPLLALADFLFAVFLEELAADRLVPVLVAVFFFAAFFFAVFFLLGFFGVSAMQTQGEVNIVEWIRHILGLASIIPGDLNTTKGLWL